jgi:beta-galactosidase
VAGDAWRPDAAGEAAPPLMLGSAWYPEQWPESRWEADLALMEAAGFRMVRVGEFAWSSLEPAEGEFRLDWLERAIDAAGAHGLSVVVGTPTDAPPAWLTQRYPETLRVEEGGRRLEHGSRRQFSYASARYLELCRRIVERMADRFGRNPHVIGWQIGNEYTEDSFDDEAKRLFHEWLRKRYGSLDRLNEHWVTAYWSQTYSSWEQVPMSTGRGNPGLMLDYRRFVTDTWRRFQRNQLEALRARIEPRQFVTTNLGGLGWANRFDRRVIAGDLDLVSWDTYVGQGHLDPARIGATHDLVRGWLRRNFWVMETQPGNVDWAGVSNSLDRGETRALTWEAIGHGADCVAYWQWRSALNGQEQYHGALVGPDGEPLPIYGELAATAREVAAASSVLAGTSPVSEVAILHDYDSRWAIDFNRFSNRWDNVDVLLGWYRPLAELAQSVDIVDPSFDLDDYRIVFGPGLNVLSDELGAHLAGYVERGGHLVLGPRSGMKDEWNALRLERQPGPLVATLGGRVEQFHALLEDVPVSGEWGRGVATAWAESLSAGGGADVLVRYGAANGWLDGQPAAISRAAGRGRITYVGALFDAELTRAMMTRLVVDAGVRPAAFPVPQGVEVLRRRGDGRDVFVVVNLATEPRAVALPRPMRDALAGSAEPPRVAALQLPRYGVAVLEDRFGR